MIGEGQAMERSWHARVLLADRVDRGAEGVAVVRDSDDKIVGEMNEAKGRSFIVEIRGYDTTEDLFEVVARLWDSKAGQLRVLYC
jgi:hypothetical protein